MSRIAEHPVVFNTPEGGADHDVGRHVRAIRHGNMFVTSKREKFYEDTTEEWDGKRGAPELEGTRSAKEKKAWVYWSWRGRGVIRRLLLGSRSRV
jgi:NADH dehydrogenase (ubiquinone) 1 alpha subcomplex subunit 5